MADGRAHQRHHQDHSRRRFLSTLGISGGMGMLLGNMPLLAAPISPLGNGLLNADSDRVLVLIQLSGGNDGLNTIIPLYDYDFYRMQRPKIGIPENNVLKLTEEFGILQTMEDLLPLWEEGGMKVVHNVGYPNPNLSHFRGQDIWSSASDEEDLLKSGWLGRWLDHEYPDFANKPPTIPPAIQIGSYGSLIFSNSMFNLSVSVTNPEELAEIAQNGELYDTLSVPDTCYGGELAYVRTISNSTFAFAESIKKAYDAATTDATYENVINNLADQLQLVARLIKGNLGSKIYMVSISGFDTHADQNQTHPQIWQGIAQAVKAFYEDLSAGQKQKDVLTMTFSEFGRRIEENASLGTDHGTAAPIFLFGPGLGSRGFVGTHSDLRNPDEFGNLIFSTDFRDIYATILEHWLCVDDTLVDRALGRKYQRIPDLVTQCGLSTSNSYVNEIRKETFHKAIYNDNGDILIQYDLPQGSDIVLEIYSIHGSHVTTLDKGKKPKGRHAALFNPGLYQITPGQYIYNLKVNGRPNSALIRVLQ